MQVINLRCEYQPNPLGTDVARPRLSWQLQADRRGARQTAYQVLVASDPATLSDEQADLWDSGRVASDQSLDVVYAGPRLGSGQRVWWTVRVWDEREQPTAWSASAWWEPGLLDRDEWRGQWIGVPLAGGPRTTVPVPLLRHAFTIAQPVTAARLYITALGLYEAEINGQRVGTAVLTPGWTDYKQRVQYQTYDVAALLRPGENVLGALLGDGWYCGHVEWRGRQRYGDQPRLLAQLAITLADGSTETIATGPDWRWSWGPLLESDLLMGESYDARRELPGWSAPGYDDARWQPVELFADPGITLTAQHGPTVQPHEELHPLAEPIEIKGWPQSRWIFDLGQNMVGRVRLRLSGPAGTTVTLRHAEVLNPDGTLYTANLRTATQVDHYTLRGDGEEVYEPCFTFHGFRYVELSGYPGTPTRATVTGIVLHSATPPTGEFGCSEPLIDQLQRNIQWGQKGNFVDVPTDCPQRDERLGWTGDAQVFVRTAAFNMDVASFFGKWLQDLADAQRPHGGVPPIVPNTDLFAEDGGPAWADAAIIVPWTIWRCYGDTRLLERSYATMTRFIGYLEQTSRDLIRVDPEVDSWGGFGDWLAQDGSGKQDGGTPKDLIGTAFFAHSAGLLAEIAVALGKPDDAERYQALRARVRQAFVSRFVTADGLVIGQTQTAYVLALHFDLLPSALRPRAVAALVRDIEQRGTHLSTGFVGTPYLLQVLTAAGRLDLAYALLNQRTWPSWLYPVTQGATTIWERWDGWTAEKGFQDAGMNSFNHYAYGAVGAWLYQVVAGIDLLEPGYKRLRLRPQPGGGLTHARARYESRYGPVESGWRVEADRWTWRVSLPPNTSALACVPAPAGALVTESGQPAERSPGVRLVRHADGAAEYEIEAGSYEFAWTVAG